MRRRLRKKKRVGEFRELGFEVRASIREGLGAAAIDAFVHRWIEAVEARQLAFGGGGWHEGQLIGFVTRAGRGSASDHDRAALSAHLGRDPAVARQEVFALCDAAHGSCSE